MDTVTEATQAAAISPFANQVLPKRAALPGLEAYAGPWGAPQAAHLLRRALFGAAKADIDQAVKLGLGGTVDALLSPWTDPDPPLNVNANETANPGVDSTGAPYPAGVPVGQTWINAPYNPTLDGTRERGLKAWWVGLMLSQGLSLREKLAFFWHNHFANESDTVNNGRYMYLQNQSLRRGALGNFKQLVKQITLDPAMLKYLNGNTNTKGHPNENYGRELQELFTIGKGPEIAPGNYTNYTEDDIRTAARVLTGIDIDATAGTYVFKPANHDTGDKAFSSAYGGQVIKGRTGADGLLELDDLLDMIFAQKETARYLCRKLYRFFVYYAIDDATEKNVIGPMADAFFASGYEIKSALAPLLKSAHFYDPANIGCFIKTPLDLVVGTARQMALALPGADNLVQQYAAWNSLRSECATMALDPLDPPNVAGWPAYYQEPVYYESWINSDTLPKRNQFTDWIIRSQGWNTGGNLLLVDALAWAQANISDPGTANTLIAEACALLLPFAPTDNQKATLKQVLLPGLADADYEWGVEWQAYLAAPTDAAKKKAVSDKLRALLKYLMDMAEYQLT